jgi:hypothetical protein
MRFSQRKGYKPVKSSLQIEQLDQESRYGLWNALTVFYWNEVKNNFISESTSTDIYNLCQLLWHNHFKLPLDNLNNFWNVNYDFLRKHFFECEWYEAYDFLEFVADNYLRGYHTDKNKKFMDFCNSVLEREVCGYRFVNGIITEITSSAEIEEIETATKGTSKQVGVQEHLNRALELLSDRQSPDYRNSIKESISAVESICKLISGDNKATLGHALKKLEKTIQFHPALKNAFNNLYGYTSDEEGIRHSLLDESNISFEDAKFMLVSCSAFINYLKVKSSKVSK